MFGFMESHKEKDDEESNFIQYDELSVSIRQLNGFASYLTTRPSLMR